MCRNLYKKLGFATWENFNFNVEKAIQLINSGSYSGTIKKTSKTVSIGSGAKREIIDYLIDDDALNLIKQLSYNKIVGKPAVRNEIAILTLLKKYCDGKQIDFQMQYKLNNFKYDALINNNLLLEFDEQHHCRKKQQIIDLEKTNLAIEHGFYILRVGIKDDIIDIILKMEQILYEKSKLQ